MTAWSLYNLTIADDVEKLFVPREGGLGPDDARAFSKETALAIVHAALWGYGSRKDSTAGAYAFRNLMEAVGLKRWSFKDDWSDIKINGSAFAAGNVKLREALADILRALGGENTAERILDECAELARKALGDGR